MAFRASEDCEGIAQTSLAELKAEGQQVVAQGEEAFPLSTDRFDRFKLSFCIHGVSNARQPTEHSRLRS